MESPPARGASCAFSTPLGMQLWSICTSGSSYKARWDSQEFGTFRRVSFATVTSLWMVGLGVESGVLTVPIRPWVALGSGFWAAIPQCPAEPAGVDISLPVGPWQGEGWGVNTLLILLPPQALRGLSTEEEMAAFMTIPLSHHRPSFSFHFSENMGVLGTAVCASPFLSCRENQDWWLRNC